MAKIPIEFEKLKLIHKDIDGNSTDIVFYQISIVEKGSKWKKTIPCGLAELTKLRNEISELIENTTTAEKLQVSNEKGKIIDKHLESDELCSDCRYRLSFSCNTCLFELQSPLERKLFLALNNNYIKYQTQYPLNWKGENISIKGKSYNNPINNFKEVLTVVDFYIEKRGVKLCIYTDGHTYHERTEEQAQRDKRIDRKLQELGFQVLRYTGKDVNENIENIIKEIKKWIK